MMHVKDPRLAVVLHCLNFSSTAGNLQLPVETDRLGCINIHTPISFFVYFRCSCGHCHVMPPATECICCMKVGEVATKAGSVCITQHSDFFGAIHNRVVLQIAYRMRAIEAFKQQVVYGI
uniref:Putative conserved secreted protein n=1 Tax=Ixodes ricinus TaxID=34613 RepID=A0A147BEL7_IXORI